jgi:hypothetical protein
MKIPAILAIMISLAMASSSLSGCTGLGNNNKNYLDTFTGTEGVFMSFMPGMPAEEMYAPEPGKTFPFKAGINVENRGSKDIKAGFLVLSAEKDYMRISDWDTETEVTSIGAAGERAVFSIKGRSSENPLAMNELFTVNLEALEIDKQSTSHTSSLTVTSCYDYETELSKDVCINPDVYGVNPSQNVCTVGDVSVSGGQGAPVEVSLIESKMIAAKDSITPQFIIHIRNSGGGSVIDKDKISDACSSAPLGYDSYDIVDIDEIKFSGFSTKSGNIDCYPKRIKMKEGEGTVRCTLGEGLLNANTVSSYTTSLYIKLSYGYTQSISKQVLLKNIMSE